MPGMACFEVLGKQYNVPEGDLRSAPRSMLAEAWALADGKVVTLSAWISPSAAVFEVCFVTDLEQLFQQPQWCLQAPYSCGPLYNGRHRQAFNCCRRSCAAFAIPRLTHSLACILRQSCKHWSTS